MTGAIDGSGAIVWVFGVIGVAAGAVVEGLFVVEVGFFGLVGFVAKEERRRQWEQLIRRTDKGQRLLVTSVVASVIGHLCAGDGVEAGFCKLEGLGLRIMIDRNPVACMPSPLGQKLLSALSIPHDYSCCTVPSILNLLRVA